jgi:hypothetical protein
MCKTLVSGLSGLVAVLFWTGAQAQGERPQDVIAAQIRTQGFACDKALGARRDAKRSKPDHQVWVLRCSNATYRVSRFPDMAAQVQRIR